MKSATRFRVRSAAWADPHAFLFFFSAKLRVGILQFAIQNRKTAVKRAANNENLSEENKKDGKEKIYTRMFFFFFFLSTAHT